MSSELRRDSTSVPADGETASQLTPKASNPLASRVTAVLSTSYTDSEFRESLGILDSRQTKNDAQTRRRLRLDLQNEMMDKDEEIVREFGHIAEVCSDFFVLLLLRLLMLTNKQLRNVKTIIDTLNSDYRKMATKVSASNSETAPVLQEASSLLKDKGSVEKKQHILAAVKAHFIMSDEEVVTLTSTAEPVNEAFFVALSKAKKISQDCEILLGFENQTLGSALMEQSSKNVNLAYQKLYKWTQKELNRLNLENPQMSSTMRRALRVLTQRPSLFQNCLDFFAQARQRILLDGFHAALTGSTSSGAEDPTIKPIDLTAHDPLRYVGDMFAWLHSAAVGEREVLEVLFVAEGEALAKDLSSGRDAEIWKLVADDEEPQEDFNALKALNNLVDRGIAGASRIMRQRIEQVIQTNEETIPAYKLVSLINFYRVTFEKLLGSDSDLEDCLGNLEAEALRQFRALVRDHITALRSEPQQAPPDMSPPLFFMDSLKQLNSIISTFETSLSTSTGPTAGFDSVLTEAFEPFFKGCEDISRSLPAHNSLIFMLNCRLASCKVLSSFEATKVRAEELSDAIEEGSKQLTASQLQFFNEASGLSELFSLVKSGHTIGASQAPILGQASQNLDNFLPSAHIDAMDRLRNLHDSILARDITERAAEAFCAAFERLEQAVIQHDVSAGLDETAGLRGSFPRTAAEIRVLLS